MMTSRLVNRLALLLFVTLALTIAAVAQPSTGGCTETSTDLCLLNDRFQVHVDFSNFQSNEFETAPADAAGEGRAVPFAADTGFFWFFNDERYELIVKVLDATETNGHFWVFAAATTNVEYTLRVTDTQTSDAKQYFNPPGTFGAAITDTQAFATGNQVRTPSASQPLTRSAPMPNPLVGDDLTQGQAPACGPGSSALCLFDDRFQVKVAWGFQGAVGEAVPMPLTNFSGAFDIFDSGDIDLLIKVLDGRSANGHFWVFAGSLSNVEYTITVTDTETGIIRDYHKADGVPPETIADNALPLFESNLAQFGGGEGFVTDAIVFNTSANSSANVDLNIFDEFGDPLALAFADGGPATDHRMLELAPHGTAILTTLPDGPLRAGSARISASDNIGVQVRYSIDPIGSAAVGPGQLVRSALVPTRRQAGGIHTGLGILNTRLKDVDVQLTLLDVMGNPVPGGSFTRMWGPKERFARFVEEFFPDADTDDFVGSILIETAEADLAIIALELGGATGDFTSISVSPLP